MAGVKMSDIAKRMGISVATVSVALNGRPGVSDALRERIIAEAAACGYDMNRLSSFGDKKLRILVYDIDHGRWGGGPEPYEFVDMRNRLIQGIEQVAAEENLELLQVRSKLGGFQQADIPEDIDGILAISIQRDETLPDAMEQCKLPYVLVGNSFPGHRLPTVCYDNQGAMEYVVQQLAAAGHKRIGFIRNNTDSQNYLDRYSGWICAQAKMGMALGSEFVIPPEEDKGHEALVGWIRQQLPDTTAFVASNDYLAMMTIRALRTCGVIPGSEVAVVGFDDMPFAALCDPPLATTRIDQPALGRAAMEYLLDRIRHPEKRISHQFIPLEWIRRESFCPAKK